MKSMKMESTVFKTTKAVALKLKRVSDLAVTKSKLKLLGAVSMSALFALSFVPSALALDWTPAAVATFIQGDVGPSAGSSFNFRNNTGSVGGPQGAALQTNVVNALIAGNASTINFEHGACMGSQSCRISLPAALRSGVVVVEPMPAVWAVYRVYRLVNAPVAKAAAVLADYPHYGTIFRSASMVSAEIISGTEQNDPWHYDVNFLARPRIRNTSLDVLDAAYSLRNVWSVNDGTLTDTWGFLGSTNHVAFAEGRARFIPVRDGDQDKTLVVYQNYMNPINTTNDQSGRNDENNECVLRRGPVNITCGMALPAMDTGTARDDARDATIRIVNIIKTTAESASGVNADALNSVCSHLGRTIPGCTPPSASPAPSPAP